MRNYDELVDIILKYMSDYDWYNLVDEYGNIENDSEAQIKAKEEILYNLTNSPDIILNYLEDNLLDMEETDELYKGTNELIKNIKKFVLKD